jgi:hypothetical protein
MKNEIPVCNNDVKKNFLGIFCGQNFQLNFLKGRSLRRHFVSQQSFTYMLSDGGWYHCLHCTRM